MFPLKWIGEQKGGEQRRRIEGQKAGEQVLVLFEVALGNKREEEYVPFEVSSLRSTQMLQSKTNENKKTPCVTLAHKNGTN